MWCRNEVKPKFTRFSNSFLIIFANHHQSSSKVNERLTAFWARHRAKLSHEPKITWLPNKFLILKYYPPQENAPNLFRNKCKHDEQHRKPSYKDDRALRPYVPTQSRRNQQFKERLSIPSNDRRKHWRDTPPRNSHSFTMWHMELPRTSRMA